MSPHPYGMGHPAQCPPIHMAWGIQRNVPPSIWHGVRRNQIYLQVRNQRNVPPSIWHGVSIWHGGFFYTTTCSRFSLTFVWPLALLANFRMLSGQEDVRRMIILERGIEMRALSGRLSL
nr:hypothetical protein Itr_chr04CG05040 [Ipomoea trifida]